MPATNPVSSPEEFSPERLGLVRDHLKDVFASRAFAGSKRAQDFLQLIVEHALAGRLDNLRERMIGAEMFGRSIDYDRSEEHTSELQSRIRRSSVRNGLVWCATISRRCSRARRSRAVNELRTFSS